MCEINPFSKQNYFFWLKLRFQDCKNPYLCKRVQKRTTLFQFWPWFNLKRCSIFSLTYYALQVRHSCTTFSALNFEYLIAVWYRWCINWKTYVLKQIRVDRALHVDTCSQLQLHTIWYLSLFTLNQLLTKYFLLF